MAKETKAAKPFVRPDDPLTNLDGLPLWLTRKHAAEALKQRGFVVSPRTLEDWEVPKQIVNGKAMNETHALFELARQKRDAAPIIVRGR